MSTPRIYCIKLCKPVSVKTGAAITQSKSLSYAHLEREEHVWKGWEFIETPVGVEVHPPWKGDIVLVPWQHVE